MQHTKLPSLIFFLTVRTNVGYKVVAHFIVQSETTEELVEALNILKSWNPQWNPPFFLCDYSEAEISAIERSFPGITVYVISIGNKHGPDGSKTIRMDLKKMNRKHFLQTYETVLGQHQQITVLMPTISKL